MVTNLSWINEIDETWTLFLDRDGVLNEEIDGDYVRTIDQLKLYENIPTTLARLANRFDKIFVVTNQRGVSKGLMTEEDLIAIHEHLLNLCRRGLGWIEKIYYATPLEGNHPMRKPQIGMALLAKNEYPEIEFSKSVMVGNSPSDILFGKNAGMKTIFVTTTKTKEFSSEADLVLTNLSALVELIFPERKR
jgi:histidinol-phosphate phosphatase family protein